MSFGFPKFTYEEQDADNSTRRKWFWVESSLNLPPVFYLPLWEKLVMNTVLEVDMDTAVRVKVAVYKRISSNGKIDEYEYRGDD
ncbi:hypothetical protein LCGC14_3088420 [marine sediment metagenome]|uniref:Uncharacterized protein n=1 Tax=marine sediment metagenome TaxID=412755 RepID=A0A0F8YIS4_9ZZZZ